jgi:very-short-patch-repair endonuclease
MRTAAQPALGLAESFSLRSSISIAICWCQGRVTTFQLARERAHPCLGTTVLHAPTPSEEALWQVLRGGALGVAFKRQVVLGGRYIADFFAPSVVLVVEVDGEVHRGSPAADHRRDERLRRLGYRVVRVEGALVMRDSAAALAVVRAVLT